MAKAANNPQAYLQQLVANNPQVNQIMEYTKQFNSPKEAFYAEAKKQGINAEDFMREIFS